MYRRIRLNASFSLAIVTQLITIEAEHSMAKPLFNEDIQAVVDALVPLMIQHDYQRRDSAWYYSTPELLRVFDFQPGQFRNKAFLNVGLLLRSLDDSTRPGIWDCSVYGRVDRLASDHDQYELVMNFADPALTTAQRVAYITKTVKETVLLFLATFNTVEDVRSLCALPIQKASPFTNPQRIFCNRLAKREGTSPSANSRAAPGIGEIGQFTIWSRNQYLIPGSAATRTNVTSDDGAA